MSPLRWLSISTAMAWVDPGEIIATDTTDDNGNYLFTGLPTDDGDGDVDYLVTVTDLDSVLQGLIEDRRPERRCQQQQSG